MFNFRPHGAGGTIKVKIEEKGSKRQSAVPVKLEHKGGKADEGESVKSSPDSVAEETVTEGGTVSLSGTELDEMGVVIEKSEADGEIYVIVGRSEEQGMEAGEMVAEGYSDMDDDGEIRQVNCPECGKAFSKISFLQVRARSYAYYKIS